MAKLTKTTKTVDAPVVENVVAPSAAPIITESKTTKAKKTKATKASTDETVAVAPVVTALESGAAAAGASGASGAAAPSEETPVEGEAPITEQSLEFLAKLQQLSLFISSLKTEYRNLEKKWTRELKAAQKQNSRRKRKSVNRSPSGFVKPTRISDELASFLGKDKGTEMARTAVTRDINAYIRTNKLQDTENGRKINPDAKLAALLKLKKTDELTYFNLQRYMSPHFSKNVKGVITAAAAETVESV
jgi:upstream activation factor subunit UAF30